MGNLLQHKILHSRTILSNGVP